MQKILTVSIIIVLGIVMFFYFASGPKGQKLTEEPSSGDLAYFPTAEERSFEKEEESEKVSKEIVEEESSGGFSLFKLFFGSKTPTTPKPAVPATGGNGGTAKPTTILNASLKVSSSVAKKTDPDDEYVEIIASSENTGKLLITGWSLEGKRGFNISIGKGVSLISPNLTTSGQSIYLDPGAKAVITTGFSPVGYSFRLNKCTGFFEESNSFTPRLPKECPYPKDEELPKSIENNDDCLDLIEKIGRCQTVDLNPFTSSFPSALYSPSCVNYLATINYGACVATYKGDSDFYKNEWRVFLNRNSDLWKSRRETIKLFDGAGQEIDSYSYK